jgi:hypothetical protein
MKYLRNNKGGTLMITIILLMIVTVLGAAMLFSVVRELQINRALEDRTIARYLAQSGIDHALYVVETEYESLEFPYVKEVVLINDSRIYRFVIDEDESDITIRSTGTVEIDGKMKRKVTMEATIQEDGQVIIEE